MKQILKTYQTKLTNLSGSNKSLLHLKAYKYADIDVRDFNFLEQEDAVKIIEKIIKGQAAKLCLIDDPRSEANNLVSKRVRQLNAKVKYIENERGTYDLYLGYPFVEGQLKEGFGVRCPLLFIPVKITENKNHWELSKIEDSSIKFNKSFLLAYAHYNKTKFASELEDLNLEDLDYEDLRTFLTVLYNLLKESNLELNFNQSLFEEKLDYFVSYKKADFEYKLKEGEIKLQPLAMLGLYPQAGSNLFGDYEYLIDNSTESSIEQFFCTKTTDIQDQKEENLYVPLPIDASQEEALKLLKSGKSVVVQGPPGTGKSQLIAQVVADYTANGKKVLLTCDKRVALDVVYERLCKIGLQNRIALVHDYNADRKNLFEKINFLIENLETTQQNHSSYDTIAEEREFSQISRKISTISDELDSYKNALFDDQNFGVSVKYLYLNSFKNSSSVPLNVEQKLAANCLNFFTLEEFCTKLNYWLPKAAVFENSSFELYHRKSTELLKNQDAPLLIQAYKEADELQKKCKEFGQHLWNKSLHVLEVSGIVHTSEILDSITILLANDTNFKTFVTYISKECHLDKVNIFYDKSILLLQNNNVLTFNVETLKKEQSLLNDVLDLITKPLGKIWYWISYRNKEHVKNLLKKYDIKLEKESLVLQINNINNAIKYGELSTKLSKSGYQIDTEIVNDEESLREWYGVQSKIFEAIKLWKTLPQELYNSWIQQSYSTYKSNIETQKEFLNNWQNSIAKIRRYYKDSLFDVQNFAIANCEKIVLAYFDQLVEFDAFTQKLSNSEHILAYTFLAAGVNDTSIIKNTIQESWIEVIENQYPILKAVSTGYLQNQEDVLQQLVQRKQELSTKIVQLKNAENSYKNLEFNRLGNRTSYRDLLHETSKKKRLKTLRQLFELHEEELLQLIPCWMASPETVSAILPQREVFDLVIFDEASQCYTEEALPAVFRAKQLLVAGDSKQLAPSSLYKARWEDEEENIDVQTDSFLDLACRYLPQTMLCEHYRSQSYELIGFSNLHFYREKLRLVPDMHMIQSQNKALEYIHVNGEWKNQCNYVEAMYCVQLVHKYLKEEPQKSIGIITFNFKQQELIAELLLNDAISEKYTLPDSLFVKNIENVQGDERDIILFSVAYAPNENGKMVSSFGSFAMAGGENRLNVAITRAKHKMQIIASILPHQLQTENSKNVGPALLKQYLQYVYDLSKNQNTNQPTEQERTYKVEDATRSLKHKLLNTPKQETFTYKSVFNFADIVTSKNGKAEGIILTDDHLYFQSRSAKEIHAYIPLTLKLKNWNVQKLYSRQWWEGKI